MIDGHRPLKNLAIIAERRGSDTHRYCSAVRLGAAKLLSPTPLVHMADVTASAPDISPRSKTDAARKEKRRNVPLLTNYSAVALAHRPAWTGHASRLIDTG